MKKLVLIIISAIMIANTGANAQNQSTQNYVISTSGTYFYESLRYGFAGFLIAKDTQGHKTVFKKSEVMAYQKDGKLFERKQVSASDKAEFMEMVAYRNGVKVYRSAAQDQSSDEISNVYLFNNENFIMGVNQKNLNYVLNFLNDKVAN